MNKKEAQPIIDMLHCLGLNIPIIILTINKTETQHILAYDTASPDLMPTTGTIITLSDNQYLLYNSAKHNAAYTEKDYPFPIKIKISSPDKDYKFSNTQISQLLDQTYKFSRIYWKSLKQQNLPITIKYPEIIAEIVPHFTNPQIPPFGKNNLWFL